MSRQDAGNLPNDREVFNLCLTVTRCQHHEIIGQIFSLHQTVLRLATLCLFIWRQNSK